MLDAEEEYSYNDATEVCTRTTTLNYFDGDRVTEATMVDNHIPKEACCSKGVTENDSELKKACLMGSTDTTYMWNVAQSCCLESTIDYDTSMPTSIVEPHIAIRDDLVCCHEGQATDTEPT